MLGKRNIYLIGPMGTGKTAVGKQVARLLGLPFVDSDHEIERHTGADIPLIFEREGEAGFRRREADVIAELAARTGIVLATGGGAVLSPENRRHLKTHGWVVYLETTVAQQAERATRTRNRPLLNGGDAQAQPGFLVALFAEERLEVSLDYLPASEPAGGLPAPFSLTTTLATASASAGNIVCTI